MTNTDFMFKADTRVKQLWRKLEKHFKLTRSLPRVFFDLRSRSCAGQASSLGHIRFNLAFVTKNAEEMINQTVPHEVAHSWLYAIGDPSHTKSRYFDGYEDAPFSFRRQRRSPHGPEFMNIMRILGADPKRTHNMEIDESMVRGRGLRRWIYKCPNCGYVYKLSTTIHNKIQRGQRRWHPKCGPEKGIIVRAH